MTGSRLVERIWWDRGALAAAARAALSPAALLYRGAVAARGALLDSGWLSATTVPLPAIGVGNLTVGGTGKTPVTAWIAAELVARGAHPAVVLRGYGGDEPEVHRRLNPAVPVIVSADRAIGIARAAGGGADIALLDDAFQQRRLGGIAHIALLSADRRDSGRLLPAGPWREPLVALRRASLVLVTRKAASANDVSATMAEARSAAPAVPVAVAHLAIGDLLRLGSSERRDHRSLGGARVLAIAAIGDPDAFMRQLREFGAEVDAAPFPDHHRFVANAELSQLVARSIAADITVCTLKDAVKLAPLWPRQAPPLWYVSQRVVLEDGTAEMTAVLDAALRSRRVDPNPSGATPDSPPRHHPR
ncbi:MAG: tetraacyldisaccharide 4'-kinase [Gemmatimonadota bacterium]|nr:tetraacyldisaccharide 4'-kinase [Gemmatimonadota bacterium]